MNTNKKQVLVTLLSASVIAAMVGCSEKATEQAAVNEREEERSRLKQEEVVLSEMKMVAPVAKRSLESRQVTLALQAPAADYMAMPMPEPTTSVENRDRYLDTPSNGVYLVKQAPLSTFSIDVDTGSYTNVRSYLNMGQKPPADAIREEAFINYFDYDYSVPDSAKQPFSVNTEIAPSPWNAERKLLRVALKGYDLQESDRKPSNLVFLVDVSGSMNEPNKLPLLVRSLSLLTKELSEQDKVSLVTYAGSSSVVLEPTKGNEHQTITDALKALRAGGGTYGESGIKLAYQQARKGFIKGGVNRVILATDGDFNVGVTSLDALKEMIEDEREAGVSLTTLGFGRGNYNDAMMEQLADIGDGNHAYIDTLHEAKKVLVRQMSGTLQSIASDVKIQIEFNPASVKEYRLIGYQNRILKDEDFNNDKVDAGEIGAGHTVTALYELSLTGQPGQIDELRYGSEESKPSQPSDELALIKVRYKIPGEKSSKKVSQIVTGTQVESSFSGASSDFQFASAVAAFAQKLKDNKYIDSLSYEQIADIARENRGGDPYNYRGEFIGLVEVAQSL